jgi:hypothetical protein
MDVEALCDLVGDNRGPLSEPEGRIRNYGTTGYRYRDREVEYK